MAEIKLKKLRKVYPNGFLAVKDIDLEIEDKEFIVFVGPSGCGKTTTLRMIAGLEDITEGEVLIDNEIVNNVSPKNRDIAMVFQNYALYPHMSVYDNMAFALKLRKIKKSERYEKVTQAAKMLDIFELLDRKPKQLSGGQRQRVALGRALVREPKAFLLDEPLSNLDAKLRVQMRTEIVKLYQKLNKTFLYVTHDQTEAMTMATRICVMHEGLIQQVDTPKNIYNNPSNKFVAEFIGSPPMNFFIGKVDSEGDKVYIYIQDYKIEIEETKKKIMEKSYIGKEVIVGVRPENIILSNKYEGKGILCDLELVEMLGHEFYIYLKLGNTEIIVRLDASQDLNLDKQVCISFDSKKVNIFDLETEETI